MRHSLLIAISIVLCGPCVVRADDNATQGAPQVAANSVLSLPAYLRQMTDWGGARSALAKKGLKVAFTYFGDAFANPVGGVSQGTGYYGLLRARIDGDLERLAGWSGASFHASLLQIHETEYGSKYLDNLMSVSWISIGVPVSTRLFHLWFEQKFSHHFSVRVGQLTAGEFFASKSANLFLNATFGWPPLTAQDLPSGGPAYPEATPGVRVQFTPTDKLTLRAAVFDGNPAGPGTGLPVERDPYGLAFRVNDPPIAFGELIYAYGQEHPAASVETLPAEADGPPEPASQLGPSDLPGKVKIGGWVHTGRFADQMLNAQGQGLAFSGGSPLQHRGDYAVYGVIDQMLWRPDPKSDRGLSVFVRAMAVPGDRNLISRYVDGGLAFKGPIASRPDDTIGIGVAYARVSPQASAYDRQLIAATGVPMPVRDFEAAIELTYQYKVADGWFVQPDLQYIIHPGANIPNPATPASASPIPNALVLGVRTILRF